MADPFEAMDEMRTKLRFDKPERLDDGDIVTDAQTGRRWIVQGRGCDIYQGSTQLILEGGDPDRIVWIPTHKLRKVDA